MNIWSVVGLSSDLAGVLLLGVDLVRVQRRMRGDAAERLASLNDVTEGVGGIDAFLKNISGDFREYRYEEGASFPVDGTFDPRSAQSSLDELKDGINGVADNLGTVAAMMVATVENDRKTAATSLIVTYTGLGLIFLGFVLQIPAYL
jgi:hypothetical protein